MRGCRPLAEAAVYRSGLLDGLGQYGLLDAEDDPLPMSEWDDDARDGWEDYQRRSGRATAGALVDRSGVAYQAGAGRAESVLLGVVRPGYRRDRRGVGFVGEPVRVRPRRGADALRRPANRRPVNRRAPR